MSLGEEFTAGARQAPTICLINPALVPDWFWQPTADVLSERGYASVIPELPRSDATATADDNVTVIESALQAHDRQYMVALSRGIEFAVRYLDRLTAQQQLHKVIGWTVISSVGPRGYETRSPIRLFRPMPRHTPQFRSGIHVEKGLEVIAPDTARRCLLAGVRNQALLESAIEGMVPSRPLSRAEIRQVPKLPKNLLPLAWYLGQNDRVDNLDLSHTVARRRFGVDPHLTDWGHVGPLSHTVEVADAIIQEIKDIETAGSA